MRYDRIAADIRKVTDAWENTHLELVALIDEAALRLPEKKRTRLLTQYSAEQAQVLFDRWSRLDRYLLVKYMDGNVKGEHGDVHDFLRTGDPAAHFIDNGSGKPIPGKIDFPGYSEKWKRAVAADRGELLRVLH